MLKLRKVESNSNLFKNKKFFNKDKCIYKYKNEYYHNFGS